jgi:hypothetical protein
LKETLGYQMEEARVENRASLTSTSRTGRESRGQAADISALL